MSVRGLRGDARTRGRTGVRILEAALELFNRDGAGRVTTNHIAAHLSISPGNLYYWYPDKQAIIRALWARYAAQQAAVWDAAGDDLPDPRELVARLAGLTDLARRYLFVLRDGPALAHEDPALRATYVTARDRAITLLGQLARTWRADGLIHPVDDERLDALATALWTLTEAWLPHAALRDAAGHAPEEAGRAGARVVADADEATRLLLAVLEPYLPD